MTCTQCGAEVEATAGTCPSCGTRVLPPPPPRWPPRGTASEPVDPTASAATAQDPPAAAATEPRPNEPAPPVEGLELVAAGLQPSVAAPERHRSTARVVRSGGGLFLIRMLTGVAVLAISITSYIAARMHNPSLHLLKWGVLEIPPESASSYKAEMVVLIIVSLICLLGFLAQSGASQGAAFFLGMTVMGIVTGNLLSQPYSHQSVTWFMTQDWFITTWICLGLAFTCFCSSFLSRTTPRQLGGLIVVGAGVTGGTVAIISAVAPSYGLLTGGF